eukprot:1502387-Pyramimonas_sp.AAC.1
MASERAPVRRLLAKRSPIAPCAVADSLGSCMRERARADRAKRTRGSPSSRAAPPVGCQSDPREAKMRPALPLVKLPRRRREDRDGRLSANDEGCDDAAGE